MFGIFIVGTDQLLLDYGTGRYHIYESERAAWAAILKSKNPDQYYVREITAKRKE